MDDLRELDFQIAELLDWRHIEREVWIPPNGVTPRPVPHWSKDPAACAELDGKMRKRGYALHLFRAIDDVSFAHYVSKNHPPHHPLCDEDGQTEWEARTRAAISALEKAKGG